MSDTPEERARKNIDSLLAAAGWAQKVSPYTCGPILQSKFAAFGEFMYQLVKRYSVAPYNGLYWEIWNEPDVYPSQASSTNLFGCWGDSNDTSGAGGGYYADMLLVVYPRIKQANSNAEVIVGGLLLDCDPNNPSSGKDCSLSNFPKDILERNGHNDGAGYFDGVAFHTYDYGYANEVGKHIDPKRNAPRHL